MKMFSVHRLAIVCAVWLCAATAVQAAITIVDPGMGESYENDATIGVLVQTGYTEGTYVTIKMRKGTGSVKRSSVGRVNVDGEYGVDFDPPVGGWDAGQDWHIEVWKDGVNASGTTHTFTIFPPDP